MSLPRVSEYDAVLACAPVARLVLDFELALFGYPLKGLARILDAILIVLAVRWQQPHDLVAATRTRPADRARRVKHGLADMEFMRPQRMAERRHLRDCDRGSLRNRDFC